MRHNTTKILLGALCLSFALMACGDDFDVRSHLEIGIPAGAEPHIELNPVQDMMDQEALKAQEEEMLLNAPLTISREFRSYPSEVKADKTKAGQLLNPLPMNADTLKRGQDLYMTYCVVCHGERGLGNGYVIPKFTKPPSLTSRKLRKAPDGDMFHIISQGQNIMSSYASQLQPMERWAVVHYIRALQRAEYPTKEDVSKLKGKK